VIGINVESNGSRTLTTKGDANPLPDARHVINKQVRGVVWYSIPVVGYVGAIGSANARSVVARLIGAALIAYALSVLIAALVTRGRPQKGDSGTGDMRRKRSYHRG
jgi:signal peptidase I